MKRIISIILSAILILSFPIISYANDNIIIPRYIHLSKATATISESNDTISGTCVVRTTETCVVEITLSFEKFTTGIGWRNYETFLPVRKTSGNPRSVSKTIDSFTSGKYRLKADIDVLINNEIVEEITVYSSEINV